jgi:hypothetical protein
VHEAHSKVQLLRDDPRAVLCVDSPFFSGRGRRPDTPARLAGVRSSVAVLAINAVVHIPPAPLAWVFLRARV